MIEKEIIISSKGANLAGTLCWPESSADTSLELSSELSSEQQGVFPMVLMLHGSGPLDRNENTKGQALNVFNDIAHYLAARGIASFRYDKRGIGKSSGDFVSAGLSDLILDAKSCLEYLFTLQHCDSDKVFVLGHSEGTIIAPQLSQQVNNIAGIILLTPFIDKMESILHKQADTLVRLVEETKGLRSLPLKLFFKLIRPKKTQAKLIARVKSEQKDVIRMQFQKVSAKWLRELLQLDPSDIYQNTRIPSLVIGGEKDLQCDPADVNLIAETIMGPVESHVVTNMSHILRLDSGKPTIFNYNELAKLPVEPEVLEIIDDWIQKRLQVA